MEAGGETCDDSARAGREARYSQGEQLDMGFEWDWGGLNWFAVIVVVVANMAISSVYYMPQVLGRQWMAAIGKSEEDFKNQNASPTMFIAPVITALVSGIALALILENIGGGAMEGLLLGLLTGLFISAMAAVPHYTFAGQGYKLAIINGGQTTLTMGVAGIILGAW